MFPSCLGHVINGILQLSVARESTGKSCKSSSLQKEYFFFFSFDICCTGFCTFFFDQSACKCHPRLIGMAAFKRVSPREWCFDSQWLQLLFS